MSRTNRSIIGSACLLALSAGGTGFAQIKSAEPVVILDPEVSREGEGARRNELNAMEIKAFPNSWDKLSDWKNGTALTQSSLAGKVTLVLTWTSWHKPSVKAMSQAKELAEKYAAKGLQVVAIHDKEGWAEVKGDDWKVADGATLLLCHDAKNEFRAAVKSDQDPDYFIIDRAGQLRHADVANDAVEEGVKLLTAESSVNAEKLTQRVADERKRLDEKSRRSDAIASTIDMTKMPVMTFPDPSEEKYEKADWPLPPMTDQERREYTKTGKKPDVKSLSLPTEGWLPKMPPTQGRCTLILFFHPDLINPSRFNTMVDALSDVQRQFGRDVNFVLAASNILNETDFLTVTEIDPEKVRKRFEDYHKVRKFDVSFLMDLDNGLFNLVKPKDAQDYAGEFFAVLSTDQKLRYFGTFMQLNAGGNALEKCLRVDPGVQARREAEDKWLRSKAK